jgi:hypothetical protein
MAADVFIRRFHRVNAVLFLVSIPPAAFFSFAAAGGDPSPVVYIPLLPLLGLTLTGTYQLVMPWVRWRRASPD